MIGAGIEFGPTTVYGSALMKVGQIQQRLGETERDFVTSSYEGFVCPLSKFLNEDMKAITVSLPLITQLSSSTHFFLHFFHTSLCVALFSLMTRYLYSSMCISLMR